MPGCCSRPEAAGRTELALTLFGMTQSDAGEIRLEGRPVGFASNRDAIKAGIAYVPEDRLTLSLVQPRSRCSLATALWGLFLIVVMMLRASWPPWTALWKQRR